MLLTLRRLMAGLVLAGTLAPHAVLAVDNELIPVYSYNREPPYITGAQSGLNFDLVSYLNTAAAGKARFALRPLPRARLDLVLNKDFKGVVAWVFPPWFKDAEQTRYLWSLPLLHDENLILSRQDKPVDYASPESLRSVRFGGVLGYRYVGIDDLVQSGAIRRSDARSEESNLLKLFARRIDATLLPRSSAGFWLAEMHKEAQTHIAAKPHSAYSRHLLIAPARPELRPLLDQIITAMPADPVWQGILAKYRITRP